MGLVGINKLVYLDGTPKISVFLWRKMNSVAIILKWKEIGTCLSVSMEIPLFATS